MNLKNIITFVKAGYTPAEIAGIDNADAVAALLNEGTKKEDIPALLDLLKDDSASEPAAVPEPSPEPVKPSKENPEPDDPTDYKEKYEALKKQMQQKEVRQNMKPEEPSSDEILAEIVKSFM